jgi:carbon catabolite-derepressing protein kinase
MNLQLYMVDSINYLVDFHHKKSYRASHEPGVGKFDMAVFDPDFTESEAQSNEVMSSGRSVKDGLGGSTQPLVKEDEVVSPYIFMDLACKLILELAGGGGGD